MNYQFNYENEDVIPYGIRDTIERKIVKEIKDNPGDGYHADCCQFRSQVNVGSYVFAFFLDADFDEDSEDWIFGDIVTVKRVR